MSGEFVGLAFVAAALTSVTSASAEQLNAADTRNFIAGKQFNYQCFEGTSGRGRIMRTVPLTATSRSAARSRRALSSCRRERCG